MPPTITTVEVSLPGDILSVANVGEETIVETDAPGGFSWGKINADATEIETVAPSVTEWRAVDSEGVEITTAHPALEVVEVYVAGVQGVPGDRGLQGTPGTQTPVFVKNLSGFSDVTLATEHGIAVVSSVQVRDDSGEIVSVAEEITDSAVFLYSNISLNNHKLYIG